MADHPLFSVILLHYNQPQYVQTALNSVFNQDYPNIELIFADDCSKKINVKALKGFCAENAGSNIKNIIWQINKENMGTVKSLNCAIEKCTGEYILFFAADDALFNENVLKNFVNAFKTLDNDIYMVSSQCHMMDIELEHCNSIFVDSDFAEKFNGLTAFEQYKVMSKSCCLAIGSTAMKSSMFKKFGKFDERYKFIEDWSYYISLTRSGGRIIYADFDGLLHRSDGISHYNAKGKLPPHVIRYKYDLIKILENEVFPYMKGFDIEEKVHILTVYDMYKADYKLTKDNRETMSPTKLFGYFRKALLKKRVRQIISNLEGYVKSVPQKLKTTLLVWASLCIINRCVTWIPYLNDALTFIQNYIMVIITALYLLQLLITRILILLVKVKICINRLLKK